MAESVIRDKSKAFAMRIVGLYRYLADEKREFILSKQLLRSGTSIGANVAEAEYAFSRKDFNSKMPIALKECTESVYWLDLLEHGGYLTEQQYKSIWSDCIGLRKILTSIVKSTRSGS